MRSALLLPLLLVATLACGQTSKTPFDDAVAAIDNHDFPHARELYRQAAASDPDLKQRDIAIIRLANIEWRVDHDAAAARTTLARITPESEQAANAWIERARIEGEFVGNVDKQRDLASQAIGAAKKREDRMHATFVHAGAAVEASKRARLAGRCTDDALLRDAAKELAVVLEAGGPFLLPVRMLLDAALMTNDGPTALAAFRSYWRLGPDAASPLDAPLNAWRAGATAEERAKLGQALADAKMFPEAALVLRDPCAQTPTTAGADIVKYEASLRRIESIANEYYRQVALGKGNSRAFEKEVKGAELPELSRRFNGLVNIGTTGGILDLHLAHRAVDEERSVSQYGRTATLRFVALDGVVSNGFGTWARDGQGGDGGWADATTIYQVRPLYADGPLRDWLRATDPEFRAEQEKRLEEETRRDEERAAREPIRDFPGLTLRLRRQYADATLAALKPKGLTGNDLRNAFLARVTEETFASSIWAHEGRHAIDKKYKLASGAPELEYRAKLSEVAFAPAPRAALANSILGGGLGANNPHGLADKRALEGVVAWMKAHAADIAGLDPAKPLMPQLDRMTDVQLREAFRSLDPLAKPAP
jgi:hypothetical protein